MENLEQLNEEEIKIGSHVVLVEGIAVTDHRTNRRIPPGTEGVVTSIGGGKDLMVRFEGFSYSHAVNRDEVELALTLKEGDASASESVEAA